MPKNSVNWYNKTNERPRMDNLSKELKIEYRKISELSEWDKNPRSINRDAFARLKAQITKLGVYKPLIVDQDNMILGGNMRYKALVDLGVKKVSVIVHECADDSERVEIALSDNDRAGYYNETELAELVELNAIDGELYSIDLTVSKTIEEITNAEPRELSENKEIDAENLLNDSNLIECPKCKFSWNPKDKSGDQ